MPTSTPSQRSARPPRGEARRTFLTEAALAVIARVGPDGLTHRLVAAEAGLPLAATTYWFSSKEDIVRAALEYAADRDLGYLESLREASRAWTAETVADRLADYVEVCCTLRRENAVVDCALWVECLRRPDLQPIAARWVAEYEDVLADVLRHAGGAGTPDDAALLGAAIDGTISHLLVTPGPFDRAAVAKRLAGLTAALVRPG
jgi:DNA-binding transcriptional regulator YbjK